MDVRSGEGNNVYYAGGGYNENLWLNQNWDGAYVDVPGSSENSDELQFQTFEPMQEEATSFQSSSFYEGNPYLEPSSSGYEGEIYNPAAQEMPSSDITMNFEDEPPLLEELGINTDHILQKTLAVLNPFRETEACILQDTDLSGPIAFCFAFGSFLLLSGKIHFGYIYGIGVLGCFGIYALLHLMTSSGLNLGAVVSVLGYCILPIVMLAGLNVLFYMQGYFGMLLSIIAVGWCSLSASKLFVTALSMEHQQPLVAYPCVLLYGVFALLAIF